MTDLQTLFEHLVAGVVVHDASGIVVDANPRAARLMGLTAERMIGRAPDASWGLLDERGVPLPTPDYPVVRALGSGRPLVNMTVGVPRPSDGAVGWLLCNAYFEHDASGAIARVVMMLLDATDVVEAQRALAASERRFRLVYESTLDAVLITRPDGAVVAANPAAQRLFGLDERALVERGHSGLCAPDDPRVPTLLHERSDRGHASGHMRMVRGDGSVFEAEATSVLYDDDGQRLSAMVLRDATLRRRLEQAEFDERLQTQTSAARASFIARVSHELRTPLNAIIGLTSVMLDERAALRREALRPVLGAAEHLARLVDDLLDWGIAETGSLRIEPTACDVAGVLADVIDQARVLAESRGVALALHAPAAPLTAMIDRQRLRQVTWNLVSNAIKYNRPGGSVTIGVEGQDARLRVTVVDTGWGMTAEQTRRLFVPFDRLGRERGGVGGSGIGLAVTRQVVHALGGSVRVDSEHGVGSTFCVELPWIEPPPAPDRAPPAVPAEALASAARTLRVLCVDDDAVNRLVLQQMAALQPGWRWRDAEDGAAGLEIARRLRPELVFIDLLMPGVDGWQLLQALRADASTRATRCIAVSALGTDDDRRRALDAGFDGYLVKPIDLASWRAEVQRVLAAVPASRPG